MTPITIDPAISGHKNIVLKTKGHGTKTQKNKNKLPHDEILEDMKNQKEEVFETELMQWTEHFDMVKPLRAQKHKLRHGLIEDKLEHINFHTYETHAIEDLLADVDENYSEDDLDYAFAKFIG